MQGQFEITRPIWLAALAVLPLLIFYWRRSLLHFPAWQRAVSLGVRILLLVVIVVALCGLKITSQSDRQFAVVAVDRSASIGDAVKKEADEFVAKAQAAAGTNGLEVFEFSAKSPTDIASAIERAGAMIPAEHVGRIVLVTEGNQTTRDALAAAKAAAVPISTVALPGLEKEAHVSAIETPGEVRVGMPFALEVIVRSTMAGRGTLTVLKNGEAFAKKPVDIVAGDNRYSFDDRLLTAEPATYTAKLETNADTFADNNQLAGMVCARPKPKVLLVESKPVLAKHLAEALKGELIDVEVCAPGEMPSTLAGLQQYEMLILSNVPADALSDGAMERLRDYVHDFGGGLIAVGGEQTFTPGGYKGTTLEEILPVQCHVRKDKTKPTLAMVLVIDRSGSMREDDSIELAKQAARQAVGVLSDRDKLGVIAFEDNSRWVSRILPCSDKQKIIEGINTITAGGGTNMHPALEKAFLALRDSFADRKHIIVLTDGVSHPGEFQRLTERIAAAGITVSTVGVGAATPELLQDIARAGGGQYYYCKDPKDMPEIFAKETVSAAKLGITERPFFAEVKEESQLLAGLDFEQVPTLLGFAETLPKDGSHLILTSDSDDPVLAWWQYGEGVSVAFTSDIQSRWAAAWLRWPDFPKFWVQLVRHAIRKDPFRNFDVKVDVKDGRAIVSLDAIDADGKFINDAKGALTVSGKELPLVQVAPGRYSAEFAATAGQTFDLRLSLQQEDQPKYSTRRGLIVGYADELRTRESNAELLKEIAAASGGVYDVSPTEIFAATDRTAVQTSLLWPYLLAIAALLFVVDVFLKRGEFGSRS